MSLYLCVFDDDDEVEGVDVGGYDDFHSFRSAVVDQLEGGKAGAKYPTLIIHQDSGEWTAEQCAQLEKELRSIAAAFQDMPPCGLDSGWQKEVAKVFGLRPANLYDCFIDVDGEPLIQRLLTLCRVAQEHGQPILFQ